jgi:hypothetical protein
MKTETKHRRLTSGIMALTLMSAAVLACSFGDETDKANKLVDEGNSAVQEVKTNVLEANEIKDKMIRAETSIKTDADLERARSLAKDAVAAYAKAAQKCSEVSKKYDEASNLKINDKFKEYLTLKVREWKQRTELIETAKGIPQALIDSSDRAGFETKVKATDEKIDKLSTDADALSGQADKLQSDNKDIFKS